MGVCEALGDTARQRDYTYQFDLDLMSSGQYKPRSS